MDERLKKQLDFSLEIDKEKNIFRYTHISGNGRNENDAEEGDKPDVGAGGVETITLIPLKAGKTEVTLTYARPWEGGEQSDQLVYTFEIDKNLQVVMSNAYSLSAEAPISTPAPVIQ